MNVTLVGWSDLRSGAFIAASRLKSALNKTQARAVMVVARRVGQCDSTIGPSRFLDRAAAVATPHLDALPLRRYQEREKGLFSTAFLPDRVHERVAATSPDVVHLHWINYGFVNPRTLRKFAQPLVWTFHDQWPMTGGCHYSSGCARFQESCGACPKLGSTKERDLSARILARKRSAWAELPIAVVAPSRWMAACAARSPLFAESRVDVIPNCVDTNVFRPLDKIACRKMLGLQDDAVILLFVAIAGEREPRKGLDLLRDALFKLREREPARNMLAVVCGSGPLDEEYPVPVKPLGVLHDEISLCLAYNSADIFISASREDNLPNTILEAMSCGTPCVGFDVGGVSDLVVHRETGFLARPEHSDSLAEGIAWLLADEDRRRKLGEASREMVLRENTPLVVANRHLALYADLLAETRRSHAS